MVAGASYFGLLSGNAIIVNKIFCFLPFLDAVNQLEFYHISIQDEFDVNCLTGDIVVWNDLADYKQYELYLNVRDRGNPEFFSE